MSNTVQIPPSRTPVIDMKTGQMTQPWRAFFENLLSRAGGVNAGLQPEDDTLTALATLDASVGVLRQTGADTFTKTAGVTGTKTPPASLTVIDGVITGWA